VTGADRERLLDLLRTRSLRSGSFVLASGATSDYYIDARLTTMSGAGMVLIGRVGLALVDDAGWAPAAVGGLTLGADAVACAIAHAATLAGRTLDAFTVRKEPKQHGARRTVEGPLEAGARVVIIEDVLTTGDSALRAVSAVSAMGAGILGVFGLVDRQQGAREKLEAEGLPLVTAFTAEEIRGL
jgi:orotate phosphoribosyltransferase